MTKEYTHVYDDVVNEQNCSGIYQCIYGWKVDKKRLNRLALNRRESISNLFSKSSAKPSRTFARVPEFFTQPWNAKGIKGKKKHGWILA